MMNIEAKPPEVTECHGTIAFITRAAIGLCAACFLGYAAYLYWPRTVAEVVKVVQYTTSRSMRCPITIDGKTGVVEIPEGSMGDRLVSDTAPVERTTKETLRAWLIVAVSVIAAVAVLSVVGIWTSWHLQGKKPPKEVSDKMDKVLTATIAFIIGLVASPAV
jgi:hypothetical protein